MHNSNHERAAAWTTVKPPSLFVFKEGLYDSPLNLPLRKPEIFCGQAGVTAYLLVLTKCLCVCVCVHSIPCLKTPRTAVETPVGSDLVKQTNGGLQELRRSLPSCSFFVSPRSPTFGPAPQQQKQALSSPSAPSPIQACDSSHFSASRANRGPDLLDVFAPSVSLDTKNVAE